MQSSLMLSMSIRCTRILPVALIFHLYIGLYWNLTAMSWSWNALAHPSRIFSISTTISSTCGLSCSWLIRWWVIYYNWLEHLCLQDILRSHILNTSTLVVHSDIKLVNSLMGISDHESQHFIINFGLVKKYKDPKANLHILCRRNCSLTGTTPYASINNHLGVEPSCHDDLESLTCSSIPPSWLFSLAQHWTCNYKTMTWHNDEEELVPDVLCFLFPEEFSIFFSCSCGLCFDDKPNYVYICKHFHDLFVYEGYQYGHPFVGCVIPDDQNAVIRAENSSEKKCCRGIAHVTGWLYILLTLQFSKLSVTLLS